MEFNFERDLYLYGDVNKMSVLKIIERLNILNRYDTEMLRNGPRTFKAEPISVYINSGGGSVYDGLALYSAIKNSPTTVVTIASGMVGSAALLIFLAGKYRVAYPYTTFLYHAPKAGTLNSTPEQARHFYEYYERLNRQLIEITRKECKLPNEIIEKVHREDYQLYMNTAQALSVEIIDSVYDLEALEKESADQAKQMEEATKLIKELAERMKEEKIAEGDKGHTTKPEVSGQPITEPEKTAEPLEAEKVAEPPQPEKAVEEKTDSKIKDLDEVKKEIEKEKVGMPEATPCDCEACRKFRKENK